MRHVSQREDVARVCPGDNEGLGRAEGARGAARRAQHCVVGDHVAGREHDLVAVRPQGRDLRAEAQRDPARGIKVWLAQEDALQLHFDVLAELRAVVRGCSLSPKHRDAALKAIRSQRLSCCSPCGARPDNEHMTRVRRAQLGHGWRDTPWDRSRDHDVDVPIRSHLNLERRCRVEHRAVFYVARARIEARSVPRTHDARTRQDALDKRRAVCAEGCHKMEECVVDSTRDTARDMLNPPALISQ